MGMMFLAGALALYFLPAIIAAARRARHGGAIFAVDLFLGWTMIGWLGALIWACTDEADAGGAGDRYPCPFCAEMILRAAKVCPHCRRDIPPAVPSAATGWAVERRHIPDKRLLIVTAVVCIVIAVLAMAWYFGTGVPERPNTNVQTVSLSWKEKG